MTGTDKQAQWASEIKTKLLNCVDQWVAANATPEHPRWLDVLAAVEKLRACENHAMWIDNRDYSGQSLLNFTVRGKFSSYGI